MTSERGAPNGWQARTHQAWVAALLKLFPQGNAQQVIRDVIQEGQRREPGMKPGYYVLAACEEALSTWRGEKGGRVKR